MYWKILACKSRDFLGNRQLLCQSQSEHSIHICPRFCCHFLFPRFYLPQVLLYHSDHFWLHHCCWLNHSENSCHKQLEPLPNMFFSSSLSCIGQIICTSGVFEHPCHHNELLQQTDCFLVLLFLSLICRKKMIYKCSRMSSYKNAMQCTHTNSKVFKASALRYR